MPDESCWPAHSLKLYCIVLNCFEQVNNDGDDDNVSTSFLAAALSSQPALFIDVE